MANPAQKMMLTGGTFVGTWAALQHGGLGAIVAGTVAFAALEYSDKILDSAARKLSRNGGSVPEDAPITDEELAEYRRLHGTPTSQASQQQGQAGTIRRNHQEPDDEGDLQRPKQRGAFRFSEVLQRFTPTLDRIYLATLPDGTNIFCDHKALCHVALAGATDAGKSNIMRMLITQLCYVGAKVLVLNPHWSGYVLDKKEDWTPIVPFLFDDPMDCRAYDKIEYYLNYLANKIIPRRLDLYAESKPTGQPTFVVIDELPAIVKRLKTVPGYLDTILKEGRKVGVYLISAAQDFLVDTIGGTGAVRDCYRTAYSVGGDDTTTNKLLGKTKADRPLGKGVVLLRNASSEVCKEAVVALVPYVDNESLYMSLGPSTYEPDRSPNTGELEIEDFELEDAKVRTTDGARIAPMEVPDNKPSVRPTIEDKGRKAEEIDPQIATEVWNSGQNSKRKLMAVFGITDHQALKLMEVIGVREK